MIQSDRRSSRPTTPTLRRHSAFAVALTASAAFASHVSAGVTVDGVRDGLYGTPLAIQTVNTQFGNNNNELNAAYSHIADGRLYLMITGNIQDNFNSIEIFIDSKPGGQSTYTSAGDGATATLNGFNFDSGFTANYHIHARRGNDGGNPTFNLDFADLGAGAFSQYLDILGGITGSGSTGVGVNATTILVGYNNNNILGISAGDTPANQTAASAVITGVEIAIDLDDLDFNGDAIKVLVGINNQDHNFWSNQFLPGLPTYMANGVPTGTGNLGGDGNGGFTGEGAINMNTIVGNQYFIILPPPACRSDINLDYQINVFDLLLLLSEWGPCL